MEHLVLVQSNFVFFSKVDSHHSLEIQSSTPSTSSSLSDVLDISLLRNLEEDLGFSLRRFIVSKLHAMKF